jgi:SAM-dependent methyltransferase
VSPGCHGQNRAYPFRIFLLAGGEIRLETPVGWRRLLPVGSITWGPEIAAAYDRTYAAQSAAPVLGPIVDLLAGLARGGRALEFAVGTGRVALALSARGIAVHGIELSPHMAERMLAKPGANAVPVTIGDMTSTHVPGTFRLVYLVANTIMNVTTQDDQLAVFANAAAHLQPGGCFVVEVEVPQLRRVPPGEAGRVFTLDTDHVGIETFDDTVAQIAWSHHWIAVDGRLVRHSAPYRYVWPSELDLMAKIAGFRVRDRWAGWDQAPFTSASHSQVAVFEKLPQPPELAEASDLRG